MCGICGSGVRFNNAITILISRYSCCQVRLKETEEESTMSQVTQQASNRTTVSSRRVLLHCQVSYSLKGTTLLLNNLLYG